MKIKQLLRGLALGTAGGLVWVGLLPAQVSTGTGRGNELAPVSQNQVIEGTVRVKAEDNLTVNGIIIDTPATVECTRAGRPIMLEDIQVGDHVRILAFVDRDRGTAVAQAIRDFGPS